MSTVDGIFVLTVVISNGEADRCNCIFAGATVGAVSCKSHKSTALASLDKDASNPLFDGANKIRDRGVLEPDE